jgi:hypothetical protein
MTTNVGAINSAPTVVQRIHQQIDNLPPESLAELTDYLEFLRFKASKTATVQPPPLRVIKLRGILKGHDFSLESLAAARREMWRKFQEDQPA